MSLLRGFLFWRSLRAAGTASWCALLLSAVLAAPAWADPPGRVGRLADADGSVWLYAPDNGDWVAADRNRPITAGDRLSTDAGAHAEVSVGSATIRLDGGSELEVLELDDSQLRFQLHGGSAAVRVRSNQPDDQIEVSTNEGRFRSITPGFYRIDRLDDASTATAWSGSLRFAGSGQDLSISPGQRVDLWNDGGLRSKYATPERDAFADWAGAQDREEARFAAPAAQAQAYVSPEMTGAQDLNQYGSWQQTPDYGAVWIPAAVAADWAPYRYGRWAWVQPWGWTWVDDAPWGFAPFHYGRWVSYRDRWCWSPGRYVPRPVYAPALVAWIGGAGASVAITAGRAPTVGWFPLGPREVYVPGYRVSPSYVRNVNVTQVTNITNVTTIINNPNAVMNQTRYMNRGLNHAVTVVPTTVLTQRQQVAPVFRREGGNPGAGLERVPRNLVSTPQVTAPPIPAGVHGVAPPPPPNRMAGPGNRAQPGGPLPPGQVPMPGQQRPTQGVAIPAQGVPSRGNVPGAQPGAVAPLQGRTVPPPPNNVQRQERPAIQPGADPRVVESMRQQQQQQQQMQQQQMQQQQMRQQPPQANGQPQPQLPERNGVPPPPSQPGMRSTQQQRFGTQPMVPQREPMQPQQPMVPQRQPMQPVQPMVPQRQPMQPVQPMQPQPAPQIERRAPPAVPAPPFERQPREQRPSVERRIERQPQAQPQPQPQAQPQPMQAPRPMPAQQPAAPQVRAVPQAPPVAQPRPPQVQAPGPAAREGRPQGPGGQHDRQQDR